MELWNIIFLSQNGSPFPKMVPKEKKKNEKNFHKKTKSKSSTSDRMFERDEGQVAEELKDNSFTDSIIAELLETAGKRWKYLKWWR